MNQLDKDNIHQSVNQLYDFAFRLLKSLSLFRIVGYGLLILTLLDLLDLLLPLQLMNPAWEFQTFGQVVERTPLPLIGLVLVFSAYLDSRQKWELPLLKLLSYLTLVSAIALFLLVPLGIANTFRLDEQSANQVKLQTQQQISQSEQIEKQLKQATPAQIEAFLKRQGRSLDGKDAASVKTELLSELTNAQKQIQTQAQTKRSTQQLNLLKKSVKWNLGALVSGTLLIGIWLRTNWARVKN